MGDVSVSLTWNNLCTCWLDTQVYKPASLYFAGNDDLPDAVYGYETDITYWILDQFGNPLPRAVEINEYWTTPIVDDYFNTTWRGRPATGALASPLGWYDAIGGETADRTPVAQNPQNPLGSTRVEHWGQNWYVGSTQPGFGVLVQANTLQKYQDHGRHE
jgi:hypothetical protein